MTFRPAHRRKKDPFARQILGVYKPPPAKDRARAEDEPGETDNYCPTCGVRISPLEAARIPEKDR